MWIILIPHKGNVSFLGKPPNNNLTIKIHQIVDIPDGFTKQQHTRVTGIIIVSQN